MNVLFLFVAMLESPTLREHVEVMELNHLHNNRGEHVLTQVIGWESFEPKDPLESAYCVRWWFVVKRGERPVCDHGRKHWTLSVLHQHRLYVIRGDSFFESRTYFDPELKDRARFPQSQRAGLMTR